MVLHTAILLLFALAGISKANGMTTSFTPLSKSGSPSFSTSTAPTTSVVVKAISHGGFRAISSSSSSLDYKCGRPENAWNITIFDTDFGTIRHPADGGKYSNCERFRWIINTTYPIITFLSFNLGSYYYSYDYLQLRDGGHYYSPFIGYFYGDEVPKPVQASSNAIYLEFQSDSRDVSSGFELQWKSSRCSPLEFGCDSTSCIPFEKRCNTIKDCLDNTDEEGCLFSGDECLENTRDFSTCAELVCRNKIWIPTGALNRNCFTCSLRNDPHFVTYENVVYDWHGQCNYSITQEGVGQDPRFALYGQFDLCVSGVLGAACLGDLVYKDSDTFAINFGISQSEDLAGSIFNVSVNGVMYEVPVDPQTGTLLGDIEEHVLAWRESNCLVILGSSGIMFKYCGWGITIWAHQTLRTNMYGLCGTIADSAVGYGLKGRNGTQYDKPTNPWPNNVVDQGFAISWETLEQTDTCSLRNNRKERQIQESACNANAAELESYKTVCTEYIDMDLPSDQLGILIDDCAFDRCVLLEAISNNPSVDFPKPEEWLNQAVRESERQADITNNTVNPADRCEGSEGWRGKCFGTQGDLSGYTKCDSLITNATGCDDGQTCCVECSFLTDLCEHKWDDSVAWKSPCLRCDRKMGEIRLGSGCSCCKRCKRKHKCKKNNGRCISDKDPIHNREWCRAKGGVIEEGWCKGRGCYCCIWK